MSATTVSIVSPIIDIHTHCAVRMRDDPFGVAEMLRARVGITRRIISNPFAAEVIAAVSSKPAIDVVKHVNDQNAAIVARAPATNWGLGTLNPLEASHITEGERCLGPLGFKGLLILSRLFDRYPRLKIAVAHMGGGLLPVMGRLDFGWRLGCDGMPERAVIRCKGRASDYLSTLYVDTMGFWAAARARSGRGVRRGPRDVRHRLRASADRPQGTHRHRQTGFRFRRRTKKCFFGAMPLVFLACLSRLDRLVPGSRPLSRAPHWTP